MTDTPAPDAPAPDAPAPDAPAPDAPQSPPEWMGALPDELKTDATLVKYKDLESLARGHLETKRLASSKIALPGENATEEDWGKVWNALGRPETPDGYADIPVLELPVDATDEQRAARDEALKPYKELAHKIGLTPGQAKELAKFDLDRQAGFFAQGEAEIDALKTQLGKDWEPKRAAAEQIFKQIFGDDEEAILLAAEMDRKVGSARFVKGMMRLAEVAGEHKIVDSDKIEGFGDVKNAEGKIDELMAQADWRKRYTDGDPATVRQYENLMALATRQALRRPSAGPVS